MILLSSLTKNHLPPQSMTDYSQSEIGQVPASTNSSSSHADQAMPPAEAVTEQAHTEAKCDR